MNISRLMSTAAAALTACAMFSQPAFAAPADAAKDYPITWPA